MTNEMNYHHNLPADLIITPYVRIGLIDQNKFIWYLRTAKKFISFNFKNYLPEFN